MRLYANSKKSRNYFKSGKTYWRCLVKDFGKGIEVWVFERSPTGVLRSMVWGGSIGTFPRGSYLRDDFGHSGQVVTFSTRKEAARFVKAVQEHDLSVPFVAAAIETARDAALSDWGQLRYEFGTEE